MAMDPRAVFFVGEEPSDNSVVAVPFDHGEDLSGVFNLQSRPGRYFVPGEIAMPEGEVGSSIRALVSAVQTFENMNRRTGELQALNELGRR